MVCHDWTMSLCEALSRPSGLAVLFTENYDVVHPQNSGQAFCFGPKYKDADWWKLLWETST